MWCPLKFQPPMNRELVTPDVKDGLVTELDKSLVLQSCGIPALREMQHWALYPETCTINKIEIKMIVSWIRSKSA